MLCKEFETTVEQEGLSPLPMAAQDHLASCDDCQNFFADLNSIVACAHQLPPELDPPQRIWVSLRAQLESEGLLKEPIEGPVEITSEGASSGLRGFRAWFTPRTFATAGVGLALAVAAFIQFQKPPSTNVAMNPSRPVVEQKAFTDPKLSPKPPNGVADEVKQEVATKVTLPSPAESAHPVLKPAPLSTAPSEDFYPAMQ